MTYQRTEVVLPCDDLAETLAFFTTTLDFKVDSIYPADNPRVAGLSAHGINLLLSAEVMASPPVLRMVLADPARFSPSGAPLVAPNGTLIEFAALNAPMVVPERTNDLVISRNADADWGTGRAGMQYRDLIPGRHGGSYIASHISIADAGPVPDYVHYHQVKFQMIFCRRGWAKLVYEDQGEPFRLSAGDCVLQPPEIRHQVLECSAGFEVIEIGCPAEHITLADRTMPLPNGQPKRGKTYGGQHFIHHVAADGQWSRWRSNGFESRDTAIGSATSGLAEVAVVRPIEHETATVELTQTNDFQFFFVLDGTCSLIINDREVELVSGDSISIPPGAPYALGKPSDDLELLDVLVTS